MAGAKIRTARAVPSLLLLLCTIGLALSPVSVNAVADCDWIATICGTEVFSTLCALLEFSEIPSDANAGEPFTVLAPNNEAIATWLAGTGVSPDLSGSNPDEIALVAGLLSYHALEGTYEDSSYKFGMILPTLFPGGTIFSAKAVDDLVYVGYGSIAQDVDAGNDFADACTTSADGSIGASVYVHEIDSVLVPPGYPIIDPALLVEEVVSEPVEDPSDFYTPTGESKLSEDDMLIGECKFNDWAAGPYYLDYGIPALDVKFYEGSGGSYSTMQGVVGPAYENDMTVRVGSTKVLGHAHIGPCDGIIPRESFASLTGAHWNIDTDTPYGLEENEFWYVGSATGGSGFVDITTPVKTGLLPGDDGPVPAKLFYTVAPSVYRGSKGTQGTVPGSVVLHYINDDGSTGPQWACCAMSYSQSFCDSQGGCTVYDPRIGGYVNATTFESEEMEEAPPSIVSTAMSVDDLSVLVQAVVAADLVEPLSDGTAALTVFAPINDAFVSLLGTLGVSSLDDLVDSNLDLLTSVLTYHVVPAAAKAADLTDGQILPTLNGESLTVSLDDYGGVLIKGVGSDAFVVVPDIEVGEGIVHVVNSVLLPVVPTTVTETEGLSGTLVAYLPKVPIVPEVAISDGGSDYEEPESDYESDEPLFLGSALENYAPSEPNKLAEDDVLIGECTYSSWAAGPYFFEYGVPALDVKIYQGSEGSYSTMVGVMGPIYESDNIARVGYPKVLGHAHIGPCDNVIAGEPFSDQTGAHWNIDTDTPYGLEENEFWYIGNATGGPGFVDIVTPIKTGLLPGDDGPVPAKLFYTVAPSVYRGSKGTQGTVPGSIVLHYINDDGSTGTQFACCPMTYDAEFCAEAGCSIYDPQAMGYVDAPTYGGEEMEEPMSIADVAGATPDLSILVEAIVRAGLLDSFTDPSSALTVFAPTNEAFATLLAGLGEGVTLNDISPQTLGNILKYHVVPAPATSDSLDESMEYPTLEGEELSVVLSEDSVTIVGENSEANVIAADVLAGNSVVHVIDAVLLP